MRKYKYTKAETFKIFRKECNFIAGANNIQAIPTKLHLPEIAFVGKSNVGKSSLINLLTGRKSLTRVSNTPGRTKQLNFFNLDDKLMMVDLPGYGYAKVSKGERKVWGQLILHYLEKSNNLKLVCLLIDARRGIKEHDTTVMDILTDFDRKFLIIFTKSDKLPPPQKVILEEQIEGISKIYPHFSHNIYTSVRSKDGTQDLQLSLGQYFS